MNGASSNEKKTAVIAIPSGLSSRIGLQIAHSRAFRLAVGGDVSVIDRNLALDIAWSN